MVSHTESKNKTKENIMTPNKIDKEIRKIQKSTKTLFKFFAPMHNFLRMNLSWYYKWHLHPYHRHVHYSALGVVFTVAAFAIVFSSAVTTHATGSAVSVTGSTAVTVNSGEKIYFSTNNSNVTIDNYSRTMAGYGWSADLGWIDFGNIGSDPASPVVADVSGNLSGKAKVLNTGEYIDFNASPTGANVAIASGGNFSGYAWNSDIGWINFSGVSAPSYNPDLLPPNNPSDLAAKSTSGGVVLSNDTWHNYATPYFSWTTPADNANGITPSGVAGYYIYFGTNNTTDPSSYQTGTNYTAASLGTSYGTYYFRVKTKDVAGNISTPATLFTYKYDNVAPTNPTTFDTYDTAAKANHLATNNWYNYPVPYFEWSGATDDLSQVAGYYVYLGTDTNADPASAGVLVTGTNYTAISPLVDGTTYYLRLKTIDNAGNLSAAVGEFIYKNQSSPPTNPTISSYDTSGKAHQFNTGDWQHYAAPYFEWSGAVDSFSGISGYYSYFGTDTNADPASAGVWTTGTNFTSNSTLTTGQTYYFRLKTKNTAGNLSAAVSFTYKYDNVNPTNPATSGAYDTSLKINQLSTNGWYNYSAPYFEWDGSTDASAQIAGYYVYFGTNSSADPSVAGAFQTGVNMTSAITLSSGQTYYLILKTKDNAGNVATASTLFTYKYETTPPTPPVYVSVTPSGYSRTNNFTFSWPVSGSSAAVDTGGSGLAKYQYKVNGESGWHDVAGDSNTANITLTDVATTSVNTFDLQVIDIAGNISVSPVRTNFYFNNSAPTAPKNLTVTPQTSTTNSFAFSWEKPVGEIVGYYYSINAIPSSSNSNHTTATSLSAGPYASQQGENTFYIVAEDDAGNYNFESCNNISGNTAVDGCAKVIFSANTAAPGLPGGVSAYDISNRDAKDYAVAVKWSEPADKGSGFDGYDIYRSSNGSAFGKVGTTSSTIYADGGLESKEYKYYIEAKDNAGQVSAATSTVAVTPTGKFTSPPKLVSGPTMTVSPSSISVKWSTDRASSSFVQIKEGSLFVSEQGQTEQTTSHEVKVMGLRSQHDYVYLIRSTDIDGNTLTGDEQKFTTANVPSVYDFNISNITQSSAIINFKSTAVANFNLLYGETANFGQTLSENSGGATTNHSLALANLKAGQMYYFRVVGNDADGNELRSENSFSTLPMPAISGFGIQPDKEAPSTTISISWQTNIPTDSTAKYSTDGVKYEEKSSSDLTIEHTITIADLSDNKKYTVYAYGRDQFGNTAESEKVVFDTPTDTRPPKISDVIIEASNVGNSGDKAQVAISWKTDEPANSQVEYDLGLSGSEYTRKTSLDGTLTNHHLVIISDLDPGKPYHLRIISADMAGNLAKSGDNTVITGDISKSALQIIVNTIQNIFGWMGKFIK
jgi:hypothetical protein